MSFGIRPIIVVLLIGAVSAASVYFWRSTDRNVMSFERTEVAAAEVAKIEAEKSDPNELLPDLIPLPASDLTLLRGEDGELRLLFSTTYINAGRGTLELRADPKTKGIREDIERDVLQRVYLKDGGYRDKIVGHFLWHQKHLHYHYADFVTYDLTSEDDPNLPELSGILQKSTFCLRDISRVLSDVPGKKEEATYKICGKELQGVSVGWGDTYYYNYPGQALNIEELASGTYRLTFVANPEKRLDELAYANNTSYVIFRYDKQNEKVQVIQSYPTNLPAVEHVYLDDPFGM